MLMTILTMILALGGALATSSADIIEYRLLATQKTSTMEKEMNDSASQGFRFEGTMGGQTAAGGNEIVVIMSRNAGANDRRYSYKLLATNKTGTMQKEMSEAGAAGYLYTGQSVYESAFGGRQVLVILEKTDRANAAYEYKLLATSRTSTMEKELNGVGKDGYVFCGITVAETAFGGREVVSILRRQLSKK
jgi:hypothetical protein